MKRNKLLSTLFVVFLLVTLGCSNDPIWDEVEDITPVLPDQNDEDSENIEGSLLDFDIQIDEMDLSGDDEDEYIIVDKSVDGYDDFIENSTFTKVVSIYYDGNSVSVSNDIDGVTIEKQGAHVIVNSSVKEVAYILSGATTDGSFKIYSSNKYELRLNGLTMTNPTGAAINIQSKKRAFVVLEEGSLNSMIDGSSYQLVDGEDMKGCFFSESQIVFSGTGTLNLTSLHKHALCSDDYIRFRKGVKLNILGAIKDGIHVNEGVIIGGGIINIQSSDDGIQSENADITMSAGKVTIISAGNAYYENNDISSSSCINGGAGFMMSGGVLKLKSVGTAGKGLNCDGDIKIEGGMLKVITTGKQYVYGKLDSSAKGIKSKTNLTINDGTIWVKAIGGEGSEGIESKDILTINGGSIAVYTYDDAINATNSITITGGSTYCYSLNNDGIDSNGTITITGGVVVASGTTSPEDGIDCDQNTFKITGGTVLGIGGSTSIPTSNVCTQRSVVYGASGIAGQYICIQNSASLPILTYQIPRTYSKMTLLLSCPQLETGNYTIYTGGSVTHGNNFYGLYTDSDYQAGTKAATFSVSSMITSVGNVNSGGGPGGRP